MRLPAQLYMRAGCHLCEVAQADLRRLAPRLRSERQSSRIGKLLRGLGGQRSGPNAEAEPIEFDLELIDIDLRGDAELLARFAHRVPVLAIGGQEYPAPLSAEVLEQALRSAAAQVQAATRRAAEADDSSATSEAQAGPAAATLRYDDAGETDPGAASGGQLSDGGEVANDAGAADQGLTPRAAAGSGERP